MDLTCNVHNINIIFYRKSCCYVAVMTEELEFWCVGCLGLYRSKQMFKYHFNNEFTIERGVQNQRKRKKNKCFGSKE